MERRRKRVIGSERSPKSAIPSFWSAAANDHQGNMWWRARSMSQLQQAHRGRQIFDLRSFSPSATDIDVLSCSADKVA